MKKDHSLFRQTLQLWVDQYPHAQLPSSEERMEMLWKRVDLNIEDTETHPTLDNTEAFNRLDELLKKGANSDPTTF